MDPENFMGESFHQDYSQLRSDAEWLQLAGSDIIFYPFAADLPPDNRSPLSIPGLTPEMLPTDDLKTRMVSMGL